MKRYLFAIIMAAIFFFAASVGFCATTATVSGPIFVGDYMVVTIAVVADGTGGAVSAEAINLSALYSHSNVRSGKGSWYLYFIDEVPGTGGAQPGAHNVTLNCSKGKVTDWVGATTAAVHPDATDDLPNYWPVTLSLTLDVDDIGANHSTTIYLTFLR